jgi:sugar phosphate isomerase/epimerase
MAGTVKGRAIFLHQFASDSAPFNSFARMCGWAALLGYKGVQIPTWDERLIDIARSAIDKKQINRALGLR